VVVEIKGLKKTKTHLCAFYETLQIQGSKFLVESEGTEEDTLFK
jgi:hypothetical protein